MKRHYLLFIAACIAAAVNGFTQTITVRDKVSILPVSDAAVTAHLPAPNIRTWGTLTNENGQADISTIAGEDSLYIRHPNYGTQGFSMSEIKNANYTVLLVPHTLMMNEVVFSANKTEEAKSEVPASILVIGDKEVNFSNPQTSADMLMNTGGVFVQKSQMGGGSPVLRGFEANKILMVVDGVRMNNAIYRAGHLQDAITVDPNMLERTEVLFGPSSVMYGSDALGGTIHFYTKKPQLSADSAVFISSNAMLRTATANSELSAHLDLNFGGKRWASLTSITRSDFGDLRMGSRGNGYDGSFGRCILYVERVDNKDSVLVNSDPLILRHTGYSQIDLNQKILFRQNAHVSHLLNFQLSNSSDIPRYDRLAQIGSNGLPTYAEWNYGPQKRILVSYTLALHQDSSFFDDATIIAAFQSIDQERISRKLNSSKRKDQLEQVLVFSLNADFRKVHGKHEMHYGIESTYNDVTSTATSTNISTGVKTATDTRYPDGGSTMNTAALYFSHSWEISDQLIFSDGIRMSMTNLDAHWDDTTFFPFPFREVNQSAIAPSGNIGLVWMPCQAFRMHVLGSTGFRAPNVDDLGKLFESSPGTLIVPNADLKPEYAFGGEAGASLEIAPGTQIEFTGFYTLLNNAIVTKAFTYEGKDSVVYDGTLSQVQAAQNADKAWIYGFTTGITGDLSEHFSIRGTVTYTYGRYNDKTNDTIIPLDHIPPVFGQTGLIYRTKGLEAEFFVRYNGWKRLADYSPSGEDNLSQATPYGTPAWATLNFRGEYHLNSFLGVNFAIENIMDQSYRHFASGMSAPGRNFIIGIRAHY
jgi:hemoglobin/transferrin/lactoferrin receptor protein